MKKINVKVMYYVYFTRGKYMVSREFRVRVFNARSRLKYTDFAEFQCMAWAYLKRMKNVIEGWM